jgi:phosphomannomutase
MKFYIFDVDGTLTPSRGLMDTDFKKWFLKFNSENPVYLATGSDAPKTIEQIGQDVFNAVKRMYNCSGNSVWENGINIYNNSWTLPTLPYKFLEKKLHGSEFKLRTGTHFDARPGLLNYSIIGRGCDKEQRKEYVQYDERTKERWVIAKEFNELFSESENIVAQVAGETGIDIMPIGKGKQQILDKFAKDDTIIFFGDKCEKGGNDHDISVAVRERETGVVHEVEDWEHTWQILKKKY